MSASRPHRSAVLRPRFLWFASLAVAALATWILWAALHKSAAEQHVERLLAGLRASGAPVTSKELARLFPDPGPEQDASVLYAAAFDIATNTAFAGGAPFISSGDLPRGTTNMPEAMRASTRRHCAWSSNLLAALPATVPPGTRFPTRWQDGFEHARLPNFVLVRKLSQSIAIHVVDAAEDGDAERAAAMLGHGFQFASTVSYDSTLVEHMIRHAIEGLMASAGERALNRLAFTDQQLASISARMGEETAGHLTNLWTVERCQAIWAFQSIKAGRPFEEIVAGPKVRKPWWERLWERVVNRQPDYSDEDFALYLELIPRHLGEMNAPALQGAPRAMLLASNYEANTVSRAGEAVLPNLGKYVTARATSSALRSSLLAALAVERFRLAQHALPSSLTELVPAYLPAVPRDPFDGQGLRYRKLAAGYTIYSVGPDGTDDLGQPRAQPGQTNGFDTGLFIAR